MHHFGTKKTCIIAGLNNTDMARVDPVPHKIWRSRCYSLSTPGLHERRSFAVRSGTTYIFNRTLCCVGQSMEDESAMSLSESS